METFCSFKEYYFTFRIESKDDGKDWEHEEFFDYSDKYIKKTRDDYENKYGFRDVYQFSEKIPIINKETNVFSIPFLQKINQYINFDVYIVYHFREYYVDIFKHFLNFDEAHQYYQEMVKEQKQEVKKWNKQLKVSDKGKLLRRYTGPTIEDFNEQLDSSDEPYDESDLEMLLAWTPGRDTYMSPKMIKQKKDCYPFQSTVYEEISEVRCAGIKCKYKGHTYYVGYPREEGSRWVLTKFNINSSHIKTNDIDGY